MIASCVSIRSAYTLWVEIEPAYDNAEDSEDSRGCGVGRSQTLTFGVQFWAEPRDLSIFSCVSSVMDNSLEGHTLIC